MSSIHQRGALRGRFASQVVRAALTGVGFLVVLGLPAPIQGGEAGVPAHEQEVQGEVRGRVVAGESGRPLAGARVFIDGTARGTHTDADGTFRIEAVPPGEHTLVVELIGRRAERLPVTVRSGEATSTEVVLAVEALAFSEMVVSATREAQLLSETAATVDVIGSGAIRMARPTHPSQIMAKVPGVWVNVTGGEGHMTAIRQPLTTEPVYLYLEDGVPTRSTGFFNHNALYEINVPGAERIEVVKGPASALYGSDAIGGTINVQTRPAVAAPGADVTLEGGEHGYVRLLGSYGLTTDRSGIRADVNLTRTDGWRSGTAYDRQSATLRWDHALGGGASLKAIAALSRIDQSTAGASRLPEDAFVDSPALNLTPVSYRDVSAARLSLEYERGGERSLLSVTPFVRYNSMEILPNWSLTYDPAVWKTANRSMGVLAKYRRDFDPMRTRVIMGVDVDRSPGTHFERSITPVRDGDVFVDYVPGDPIYDYDVTFLGVSPYAHVEASPAERIRVTAGLRFDRIRYRYDNALGPLQSGVHRRPESTSVHYSRLNPKLGATFDLGRGTSAFVSWSQGFRTPSEGQLFRQGVAVSTVDLEPVVATNREVGFRGSLARSVTWSLAAYRMVKRNDILAFQREDDVRETRNAGETRHQGIEAGLGVRLPGNVTVETALSVARHTFLEWRPTAAQDLSGNAMESAPRATGNTTVGWMPAGPGGPRIALGWTHLGPYWLDAENTERYGGHDVFDFNVNWPVSRTTTVFASVANLTDRRYAESGGYSQFRGREFAPGMPRTLHAGIQLTPGGS